LKKQNHDKETHETWNKVAQLYNDHFMELELYNDTYDLFCQSITKSNPDVLEIGCGPGNITKYISNNYPSFNMLATDYAESMIQLAKQNNPSLQFQVMDCRSIVELEKKFDGIICGFILPYLSADESAKLIENCCFLLKEEGKLYLSFVDGDYAQSGYVSGSTGDRTYFYYHPLAYLKKELEKNGFTLSNVIEKSYQKRDKTSEIHTILIVSKKYSP